MADVWLCGLQLHQRPFYAVGCEDLSEQVIEGFDEEVFFEKNIGGVFEMIRDGIFTE